MTFEELNASMKILLETENIERAIELYLQEKDSISLFDNRQKYIINEKVMLLEYKVARYDDSMRINEYLNSIAVELGQQYVLTANLWKINIYFAKKEYNRAIRSANNLKLQIPKDSPYRQALEADIHNTLLRIYIASKKYKRMRKLGRRMLGTNIDEHSKMKLLMNMGVAYYSLGKYSVATPIFIHILTLTYEKYFLGCANLYLARMAVYDQKKELYIKSIVCFEKLDNSHLLGISQQEYNMLFDSNE